MADVVEEPDQPNEPESVDPYYSRLFIAILVGGFLLGALLAYFFVVPLSPVVAYGDPQQGNATFRSSLLSGGLAVVVGSMAAIFVAFHVWQIPFWLRLLAFAAAVSFMTTGTWLIWTNKVELEDGNLVVRTPGSIFSQRYHLGNGNRIEEVAVPQPNAGRAAARSICYRRADGTSVTLCSDTRSNPVWSHASPHLIRIR